MDYRNRILALLSSRSMVGREINGLLGRERQKDIRRELAAMKRDGLVRSEPTNNRRLGTRWYLA